MNEPFIHPSAYVEEGAVIGKGTSVWHQAHVRRGAKIGSECVLGKGVYVGPDVTIGDRCKVENHAMLFDGCSLDRGVFIGPGAQLANDRFPRAITPEGELKGNRDWTVGHVRIEEGASIGAGAIVVPDARIGRWAMVGAGTIVTRDVAPHELVAGNPPRRLGFVCSCGRRLAPGSGPNAWTCGTCGRTFELGGVAT